MKKKNFIAKNANHHLSLQQVVIFCNRNRDNWSQITITNIIMMKKVEISPEFPKCDTETRSEQMLLEKWHQWTCLMQGGHKSSICLKKRKKTISAKCNKVKHSKWGVHVYTVEYYSATKKEWNLTLATPWMDLEGIMLSEINQTEKDK